MGASKASWDLDCSGVPGDPGCPSGYAHSSPLPGTLCSRGSQGRLPGGRGKCWTSEYGGGSTFSHMARMCLREEARVFRFAVDTCHLHDAHFDMASLPESDPVVTTDPCPPLGCRWGPAVQGPGGVLPSYHLLTLLILLSTQCLNCDSPCPGFWR